MSRTYEGVEVWECRSMSGRVLFLPCSLDGLAAMSASVRFRAQWPAKYWDDADCYDGSQRLTDYDVFVFQKLYLTDHARAWAQALTSTGKLLAFDLCDANWLLSEEHKRRLLAVLPLFDFAVAPTKLLVEWLGQWLPARHIPDRLDLEVHQEKHEHKPGEISLVWFGYSGNLVTLETLWSLLRERGFSLTIISDGLPEEWESESVRFVRWTPEGANAEIARHDVALNPGLDKGHFAYKSHNKTITAWALGVPVAKTLEEMLRLRDYDERVAESKRRLAEVRELWDVRISVREWARVVAQFRGQ